MLVDKGWVLMARLFEGAQRGLKSVLAFCAFALVFWLAELAYQLWLAVNGNFQFAIVRSLAFAGTTLIAASLLSSTLFKFRPPWAKHWALRRSLGVAGTFFVLLHVLAATQFYFGFNLATAYPSLNPFENPLVFGALALPLFTVISLISTDWAVQKLGAKWKAIQRLVYPAFMLAIFHFTQQNPAALEGPPWLLLAALTTLAVLGELYWFLRTTCERRAITTGTFLGLAMVLFYRSILN